MQYDADGFAIPQPLHSRHRETVLGIFHAEGTPWYDAPLPRRWHFCRPWTISVADAVDRCACGAIRSWGMSGWLEKNSRRRRPKGRVADAYRRVAEAKRAMEHK